MSDLVTSISSARVGWLFGKTREAVLGLLVLRADERFHLRQVSRLTGSGLGPVQRELKELVAMGVISREVSGRQVYFQARGDCPFLPELRHLLLKTSGVVRVLKDAFEPFREMITAALVFGSMARGGMTVGSDVDVLLISPRVTMRELGGAVRVASGKLGRDVNVNLYRPEEWSERMRGGHRLARSIMEQPRLFLFGDEDELVRLAEKRVVKAAPTRARGDSKVI